MIFEFKTAPEGVECQACFFTLTRYAKLRVIQRTGDKSMGRRTTEEAAAGQLSWTVTDMCLECFQRFIVGWLESALPDCGRTQRWEYKYVFPTGMHRVLVLDDE